MPKICQIFVLCSLFVTVQSNMKLLSDTASSHFQQTAQFSTPTAASFGGYQTYSLDRLNVNCSGLGINFFQLGDTGLTTQSFWYKVQCVTPGFVATSSIVLSNIPSVQGGVTPAQNIKILQYLTPYIADCSGGGGAITQLHYQSTNSYLNSGYTYSCGSFGGLYLSQCRTVINPATSVGPTSYSSGNANYLDTQAVSCNSNEALQTLKWTYNGDVLGTGQYIYTCCQFVPCPYNYYASAGACALCPAGQSSSGGGNTVCYPIQFNQQPQFQLTKQDTGTWKLYYMDRLNLNCNGQGINYFLFSTTYGSTNYGSYNIKCAFPGFVATTFYSYTNVVAVLGGTVPVLNFKHLMYLTPYIADCSGVGGAITQMQFISTNSYADAGYSYTCGVFGSFSLSSCREVTNPAASIGSSSWTSANTNYLDRETVACNSNEVLQTLKWTYNGDTAATGQYVYTCCQYQPSCPINTYYTDGVCTACPSGYQSMGGISTTCYPQPSSQPTAEPTSAIPTLSPSWQPTIPPSFTPTINPSTEPSQNPSKSPSAFPSVEPTSFPSAEPTYIPSGYPSIIPSVLPSSYPTSVPTTCPSVAPSTFPSTLPSTRPSSTPSIRPTASPSYHPSVTPTLFPSYAPSANPSTIPTVIPSQAPSIYPSQIPSMFPTSVPSISPTVSPTPQPTETPSILPSQTPSCMPSVAPTMEPSILPSVLPSTLPSKYPSSLPSAFPNMAPTFVPTAPPSQTPTLSPTAAPSTIPSTLPSVQPSNAPSIRPTLTPSILPSSTPTTPPSTVPSDFPSVLPSSAPSTSPSISPSLNPTLTPSVFPSLSPSLIPTNIPSTSPSQTPSETPTQVPSTVPTGSPSLLPSTIPTLIPSNIPTLLPSSNPSASPTTTPSSNPTLEPTTGPTSVPTFNPSEIPSTLQPSTEPSIVPSVKPTCKPTKAPVKQSSHHPSALPSMHPSIVPSLVPTTSSIEPSLSPSVAPSSLPSISVGLSQSSSAAAASATVPAYVIPIVVVPLLVGLLGVYLCVRYSRRVRKQQRVGQWMGGAVAMTVLHKEELNVEDVYSQGADKNAYTNVLDKQLALAVGSNPLNDEVARLSETTFHRKSLQTDASAISALGQQYAFTTNPAGLSERHSVLSPNLRGKGIPPVSSSNTNPHESFI